MELSVVVPIYNEEDHLMAMADALAPELDKVAGEGCWQFVLVDNGSHDRTPEIVSEIKARWPNSIAVNLARANYGEALLQGFRAADSEWAFVINVDFWDAPFLSWCWHTKGLYDYVLGSKRADTSLNKMTRYRRTLSWGLNSILQFVFGYVGTDTHGLKFVHLPVILPIANNCVMRRGQFDTELTLRTMRSGHWLAEVPVPIEEVRPKRNFMIKKIMQNVYDIFRLRKIMKSYPANRPIRYHRWAREDILDHQNRHTQFMLSKYTD